MKTLVIHYSKFGNTQKVAEAMAAALETKGNAQVVSLDALSPADYQGADLVIMGSPTHRMNLPEDVRVKLHTLPRKSLCDKKMAAFDTSYKMSGWLNLLTASKKLSRKLKKLGAKRVVPPETFHVMESKGPLYDGEIERAQEWARLVGEKSEA
jgi:flavodoxin